MAVVVKDVCEELGLTMKEEHSEYGLFVYLHDSKKFYFISLCKKKKNETFFERSYVDGMKMCPSLDIMAFRYSRVMISSQRTVTILSSKSLYFYTYSGVYCFIKLSVCYNPRKARYLHCPYHSSSITEYLLWIAR